MSLFSNNLKRAIEECGVPVSEIAQRCGISAAMLYKIQNGTRVPDSIDTLNRMLDAMLCALPARHDLVRQYQVERIGELRHQCFHELKEMLAELARIQPLTAERLVSHEVSFPAVITGTTNVNAVVQNLLEKEAMRPGGSVQMMVSLNYMYCFECLSQVLAGCHPDFGEVTHLFCFRDTATDEAMLHNMRAIRTVLPRMLTMAHYDPRYSYLPDPNNGAVPFPHHIITSAGVLLISGSCQNAIFLSDPAMREKYLAEFNRIRRQFVPIMNGGSASLETYFHAFYSMVSGHPRHVPPTIIAPKPCVLPCLGREIAMTYLPPALQGRKDLEHIIDVYFSASGVGGYTTFFTMEGLMDLLDTGVIMELVGDYVPCLSREHVILAVERTLEWARAGKLTMHLFREDVFHGPSSFSLSLYETRLLTFCDIPTRQSVFADITEMTLARTVKTYVTQAEILGDVYSAEESIALVEQTLRRFQMGTI